MLLKLLYLKVFFVFDKMLIIGGYFVEDFFCFWQEIMSDFVMLCVMYCFEFCMDWLGEVFICKKFVYLFVKLVVYINLLWDLNMCI